MVIITSQVKDPYLTPFVPTRLRDGLQIHFRLHQNLFRNLIARYKLYISKSTDMIDARSLNPKMTNVKKVGGEAIMNIVITAVQERLSGRRDI